MTYGESEAEMLARAEAEAAYYLDALEFKTVAAAVDSIKEDNGTVNDQLACWMSRMPSRGITASDVYLWGYPQEVVDAVEALSIDKGQDIGDWSKVQANDTALFVTFHIMSVMGLGESEMAQELFGLGGKRWF